MSNCKPEKIRTRYVGPRGYKGARVIAYGAGRQKTTLYDHGVLDMHVKAGAALAGISQPQFLSDYELFGRTNADTGNVYYLRESYQK